MLYKVTLPLFNVLTIVHAAADWSPRVEPIVGMKQGPRKTLELLRVQWNESLIYGAHRAERTLHRHPGSSWP